MIHFREIAAHYGLGGLLSAPEPVLGGLLHTTYRLDTPEGSYAAKILNPAVMKRPSAADNMIRSERIARAMAEHIPAVAAVERDGSPLSLIGGEYVMLYPWLACRPVFPPTWGTRSMSCWSAGNSAAVSSPRVWEEEYASAEAAAPGAPWLAPLKEAVPLLDELETRAVMASPSLTPSVLSHRDLDPKNVLWEGPSPRIIDWESAGETDPAAELLEALLSWSACDGQLREDLFRAMADAYRSVRSVEGEPWDAVFDASFRGPLDWLAYNVRRASGQETDPDGNHDRMVGASEVSGTLRALSARIPQLETAREWLGV